MKNKQTESKLRLMENRIKSLKREESKARWRIKETIRKGELHHYFRQQQFEHDMYKQDKWREMEEIRMDNQKKILQMRNQIMSNISNQRNSVYYFNRKAKEEVAGNIKVLKQEKHKIDKIEESHQKMKKLSYLNNHYNAKYNQSFENFTKQSMVRKNYDDKINYNFESSQVNNLKIKQLEMLEKQLLDRLKDTYTIWILKLNLNIEYFN